MNSECADSTLQDFPARQERGKFEDWEKMPNGQRPHFKGMHMKLVVLGSLLVAVLVFFGLMWSAHRPSAHLRLLLEHGTDDRKIRMVTILTPDGHAPVVVDNPALIASLNESLRHGAQGADMVMRSWPGLKNTYRVEIVISPNTTAQAKIRTFDTNNGITIELIEPFYVTRDTYPYWVSLSPQVADRLVDTIEGRIFEGSTLER